MDYSDLAEIDNAYYLLPSRMQRLVDVIGLSATLKIVEKHGGGRIHIPERPKWLLESKITGTADDYAVEHTRHQHPVDVALSRHFGGMTLEIDRCEGLLRAALHEEMRRRMLEGATTWELAREYGYTERGIRKIKCQIRRKFPPPREARQHDLFEDL